MIQGKKQKNLRKAWFNRFAIRLKIFADVIDYICFYYSITISDERIPRRDEDHKKKFVDPEEAGSGNGSDVTLKSLLLAQMIIAVLSFVVLQMVKTPLIFS